MNTETQYIKNQTKEASATMVENARRKVQEAQIQAQKAESDAQTLERELEEAQVAEMAREEATEKSVETKAEIDRTIGG